MRHASFSNVSMPKRSVYVEGKNVRAIASICRQLKLEKRTD